MSRLIMLCVLLAACAAPAPRADHDLRRQSVPIWSAAAFDAARLGGRWSQTGEFAANGAAPCAGRGLDIGADGSIKGHLCVAGDLTRIEGQIAVQGPGRLILPGIAEPAWVLWADEGYRTLALGTPNGRFGILLERGTGPTPPDRRRAAHEIFDWNGYVLERLR